MKSSTRKRGAKAERENGKRGRPQKDDRRMRKGMLWLTCSGAQRRDGATLEAIFHALSADADMENLGLDSTCIKVHESANRGGKRRIRMEWQTVPTVQKPSELISPSNVSEP